MDNIDRMRGMIDCVRAGIDIPIEQRKHTLPNKSRNNWHKDVLLNELGRSCVLCGATTDLCIHHKIPYKKGGLNRLSNLSVLCATCHRKTHISML